VVAFYFPAQTGVFVEEREVAHLNECNAIDSVSCLYHDFVLLQLAAVSWTGSIVDDQMQCAIAEGYFYIVFNLLCEFAWIVLVFLHRREFVNLGRVQVQVDPDSNAFRCKKVFLEH